MVRTSSTPPGVEYCTVRAARQGWALQGSVVRWARGDPAALTYAIEASVSKRACDQHPADQADGGDGFNFEVEADSFELVKKCAEYRFAA